MKINGNTKVSKVIKDNKEAIEAIASLNPHFTKLRNPVLRRILAPRVTLAEAAKIGQCDVQVMLDKLVAIGFELDRDESKAANTHQATYHQSKTKFLEDKKSIVLDVRPLLAKGEDPFNLLQKALKNLNKDEVLEVLVDFEPIPLIRIQEKKGFVTFTFVEKGVYHTYFKASAKIEETSNVSVENITTLTQEEYNAKVENFDGKVTTLDVRDLEMPEPLIRILESVEILKEKEGLKIFHKRIPQHLLPELEKKNLQTFICPISEGNVMLFITQK